MPQSQYENITTGDGSPSLALPPTWEPMHSLEGAFSETLYIYAPAIKQALENTTTGATILSVGLGVGYNEILTACLAQHSQKAVQLVWSCESQQFLIDAFKQWVSGKTNDLSPVYEHILELMSDHYDLDNEDVKRTLFNWLESGVLKIEPALTKTTALPKANAILFDAFSKKTTKDLWEENFLTQFFEQACAEVCFVSTYACTGHLYRTLNNNSFQTEKRKGFGKKRQSTFAHRRT